MREFSYLSDQDSVSPRPNHHIFIMSDDFDIIFLYRASLEKYVKGKCSLYFEKQLSFKYFANLCFIPKLFIKIKYPVNFLVFSALMNELSYLSDHDSVSLPCSNHQPFTASDDFDIIFLYKAPLKKYVKEKCFIPKLYMKNVYPVNFQVLSGLTVYERAVMMPLRL